MPTIAALFWLSAALLAFTFAGYPLLIALLARFFGKGTSTGDGTPTVTVLLIAHNEQDRILPRIANLLASDYPHLHILVVSDGSTDDTVPRLLALHEPRLTILQQPTRSGKPAGLNAGIAACTTDLIVLTDARQTFTPDTIRRLVTRLLAPGIGAVSGELQIAPSPSGTGSGVDAYWRLERFLRHQESQLDSCIGCTGAVYAIRRTLYRPIPPDTALDDVLIPMSIALTGHRILHEPLALAHDPQPLDPSAELRRKRRTLAGNFQLLFRHPEWLLPWRNRLWWQLLAHKYLRLLAPLLLLLALATSAALSPIPLYRVAFLLQCAFYLLAALGSLTSLRSKCLTLPAGFVFLNLTVLRAFYHYLTTPNLAHWQTTTPPEKRLGLSTFREDFEES